MLCTTTHCFHPDLPCCVCVLHISIQAIQLAIEDGRLAYTSRLASFKISKQFIDKLFARNGLTWKRVQKMSVARIIALTPGIVSNFAADVRAAINMALSDVRRISCWDQTPLEPDLKRLCRFKVRACATCCRSRFPTLLLQSFSIKCCSVQVVGITGSGKMPVIAGVKTMSGSFNIWICITCAGKRLEPVLILRGGSKDVVEVDVNDVGEVKRKRGRPRKDDLNDGGNTSEVSKHRKYCVSSITDSFLDTHLLSRSSLDKGGCS